MVDQFVTNNIYKEIYYTTRFRLESCSVSGAFKSLPQLRIGLMMDDEELGATSNSLSYEDALKVSSRTSESSHEIYRWNAIHSVDKV